MRMYNIVENIECVLSQGAVKFREGIRDVDDLRVLQIEQNSTGIYDWIKVCKNTLHNSNI